MSYRKQMQNRSASRKRTGSRGRGGDVRDPSGGNRKLSQLCQQVFEALTYALMGSADEALRVLAVVSVVPAPDASRLLVTIRPSEVPVGMSPDELIRRADSILERLGRARGYLRSEVAASIHRKRTPELTFSLAALEV